MIQVTPNFKVNTQTGTILFPDPVKLLIQFHHINPREVLAEVEVWTDEYGIKRQGPFNVGTFQIQDLNCPVMDKPSDSLLAAVFQKVVEHFTPINPGCEFTDIPVPVLPDPEEEQPE